MLAPHADVLTGCVLFSPFELPQAARSNSMKITGIRTVVVNAEMRNWIFVRVDTDQPGLHGWGEATLEWKTRAVVGAVDDLAPLHRRARSARHRAVAPHHAQARLLAHRRDRHQRHGRHRGRTLGHHGQEPGRSGLAPARRKACATACGSTPISASARSTPSTTACRSGPLVERAQEVLARGYTAMKVVFIPYTHYTASLARHRRRGAHDGRVALPPSATRSS